MRKADIAVKWGHDKFMELELMADYGYHIRNEDNVPRARRRLKRCDS